MSVRLFAIELVAPLSGNERLRAELREILRTSPPDAGYVLLRRFLDAFTKRLEAALSAFSHGVWDDVAGDAPARAAFGEWIETSVHDARVDIASASPPGGERFLISTFALLAEEGSAAAAWCSEKAAMDPAFYWLRGTFRGLLTGARGLDLRGVRAAGAVVVPGDGAGAITRAVLEGPRFSYLRRLV